MSEEMYREHILDLYKNPRNFGELKGKTHSHREFNPLCGDDITMDAVIEDGRVKEINFHGHGCALSIASASLLTEEIKGMRVEEVMKLTKDKVLELMMIPIGPVRIKCALLPLETIHKLVMKHA